MIEYPILSGWLEGVAADHIWLKILADGEAPSPQLLRAMEAILANLEHASVIRLARKKLAFQTNLPEHQQLNLRVELAFASTLIDRGAIVEFGGDSSPDLLVRSDNLVGPIYIEIGTRSKNDPALLREEIGVAISRLPVQVKLLVPQQILVISEHDRTEIVKRIFASAAGVNQNRPLEVHLPEINGTATCHFSPNLQLPSVTIEVEGYEIGDYMTLLEREILNVLADKTVQAIRNGWHGNQIVIIDISRLGLSWMRPDKGWQGALPTFKINWSNCPFVSVVIGSSDLRTPQWHTIATLVSPSLHGHESIAVNSALERLGLN